MGVRGVTWAPPRALVLPCVCGAHFATLNPNTAISGRPLNNHFPSNLF